MSSEEIIDVAPVDADKTTSSSRKRLIVIGAAVAVLLVGGVGGYFAYRQFAGGSSASSSSESASSESGSEASKAGVSSYVEVPPLVVNLRGSDASARFLKLRFIIVAADEGKAAKVKEKLPVVLDALQPFLRELRPDDLDGSAAVFRIKEEMMRRTTQALGPGMVSDVLIQDLIQQ
ncbi:flagellar FliL protein [Novosphingobium sp. PhB165]|uniref:flagellar basal body-associated FliL family protein n=1 Tax=Novosphingobium sp. PhB165 TaxID=2485105 RepID=UPI001050E635|nr:flagellar basal body-associated FliL family protein [Novosphingobium sp. PhB165]TCM17695.1 flagellar FliL protein [Novosphingobium sp. PhB165]